MIRVLRFLRLSASDRKLLIKAATLLWIVRLGLWLLPFHRLRDLLRRFSKRCCEIQTRAIPADQITRSVRLMSRYVPAATCLTQALVTVALLEAVGCSASLRIGVAKSSSGKLGAHAWVESEGRVVIGNAHVDLTRFTVLHAVEGT